MRQAERLLALRALLARVQANAKERRAELAAVGLGPDAPRVDRVASDPPVRAAAPRARERIPSPMRAGFDDDWSSLLTRDLNDPSPERPPRAAGTTTPPVPAMPFSRVASFAPPPVPEDLAKVAANAAPASARLDEEERHPDSEIVKAIRLAAEHPHPVVDPRDLWTGAGPQLRERKPATNPPAAPPPEEALPDDDGPVIDLVRTTPPPRRVSSRPPPGAPAVPPPTSAPATEPRSTPAPDLPRASPPAMSALQASPGRPDSEATRTGDVHDEIAPPAPTAEPPGAAIDVDPHPNLPSSHLPRPRGRRIERVVSPRRRTHRRVLAALIVAAPLAGLATWSLLDVPHRADRGGDAARSGERAVVSRPAPSVPVPTPSGHGSTAGRAPPIDSSTSDASERGQPAEVGASPPAREIPPPPAPGNPHESGMLWVDADPASAVYVQGVAAGESGVWLEVACGMKNVRLARRGLPPPGHSFPMWLGVGRTVLIPCGGSHRIALRPD